MPKNTLTRINLIPTLAILIVALASGRLFAGTTNERISDLIAERNRARLNEMVKEISALILDEANVDTLISAAKADNSDAHRVYLWIVLFGSQSENARQFLEKQLADIGDGLLLQFLDAIHSIHVSEVPFLSRIYTDSKSLQVKDAIVRLVHDNIENGLPNARPDESGRNALITWMVKYSENPEHRLEAMKTALARPGTNDFGEHLLSQALERERELPVRNALFALALNRNPDRWLGALLKPTENAETKLAGLEEFRAGITEAAGGRAMRNDRTLTLLKQSASRDPSTDVRKRCDEMLALLRARDVESVVQRFADQERQFQLIASGKSRMSADDKDRFVEQSRDYPAQRIADHEIERLKSTYGSLPEEEKVRDAMDHFVKKYREAVEIIQRNAER